MIDFTVILFITCSLIEIRRMQEIFFLIIIYHISFISDDTVSVHHATKASSRMVSLLTDLNSLINRFILIIQTVIQFLLRGISIVNMRIHYRIAIFIDNIRFFRTGLVKFSIICHFLKNIYNFNSKISDFLYV